MTNDKQTTECISYQKALRKLLRSLDKERFDIMKLERKCPYCGQPFVTEAELETHVTGYYNCKVLHETFLENVCKQK